MKFWKYGRIALASIGLVVLGMSITCCGVYTSGYMYVTGAQYNNIGAFKIDHDYGYLTPVTGSPFAAGGNDPVQELVLPGGRFLAVVNKGSNSVSIFSIGGAGVLYFQHTYSTSGTKPVSIGISSSGTFMYVVDQLAPDGSGKGDVTVFQINSTTGQLTLITNANTFNTNGSQLPYFEVNYKPVQVITAGGTAGSYLYVLDQAYNVSAGTAGGVPAACINSSTSAACGTPDVFLYAINSSTGQLTLTQNAPLALPGTRAGAASTIYTSGSYVWIADTELNQNAGRILPFTIGTGGVLQTLVGGPVPNATGAAGEPDAILANSTTQFLYVANYGPPSNPNLPTSNISAFTIDPTNGQLTPISLSLGTYTTGSGPVWIAEDSTNQYLYTANFNDNTITGKVIDATHGQLSVLNKGTQNTPTVGQPTFVAITARTF